MNEINFKADMKVTEGPTISLTDLLKVDTYRRSVFVLDVNATNMRLDLPPIKDVQALLIVRTPVFDSKMDPPADTGKVWYRVNGKGDRIPLDSQHLLFGTGSGHLLGPPPPPQYLCFTNELKKSVTITVFIGLDQRQEAGTGCQDSQGGSGNGGNGGSGNDDRPCKDKTTEETPKQEPPKQQPPHREGCCS